MRYAHEILVKVVYEFITVALATAVSETCNAIKLVQHVECGLAGRTVLSRFSPILDKVAIHWPGRMRHLSLDEHWIHLRHEIRKWTCLNALTLLSNSVLGVQCFEVGWGRSSRPSYGWTACGERLDPISLR